MADRRPTLSHTLQRRALRRRLPLHIEKLETRCMLMADEVVPADVIEPIEDDMGTPMALECCPCSEILPLDYVPDFAGEPLEFLIDPVFETGEIDSSELMFFSMGFEGVEPLPSEEDLMTDDVTMVLEEPVDIVIETDIDPLIFASFSVTNVEGPGYEGPLPDPIQPIAGPLTDESPFQASATPSDTSAHESESEIATPSPEIPAAKAFAAFGRSPNSLAASIAYTFGTVGFAGDAQGDDGFIGGRRRGRR